MADWETLEERELARVELKEGNVLIGRFVRSKPPDKDEVFEQIDLRRWYMSHEGEWRPTKTGIRISKYYADKLVEVVSAMVAALDEEDADSDDEADGNEDAGGETGDDIPF